MYKNVVFFLWCECHFEAGSAPMPPLHGTQNNTDKMGNCLDTLIGSTGPRIMQQCSKTVQCLTTAQSCSVMLDIKWVTIMGWNGGNDAVFYVVSSGGSPPVTLPWMLVLSLLFCYVVENELQEFSIVHSFLFSSWLCLIPGTSRQLCSIHAMVFTITVFYICDNFEGSSGLHRFPECLFVVVTVKDIT